MGYRSIHLAAYGHDSTASRGDVATVVSIHAPRAGGDARMLATRPRGWRFNPRPPRGGRPAAAGLHGGHRQFQSTPPARGGRPAISGSLSRHLERFNPRPPRGGRPAMASAVVGPSQFQSTPPARGATRGEPAAERPERVSIHAPRAGGDPRPRLRRSRGYCFNPRPPRGGRRVEPVAGSGPDMFQSTPPARGATRLPVEPRRDVSVSIHAPRAGGDVRRRESPDRAHGFNPRPPRGGRRRARQTTARPTRFQSTPPARGATRALWLDAGLVDVSIHAPRAGGDTRRSSAD